MKLIGKIITDNSDFDPQPIFIVETDNLSCELGNRMIVAVSNQEEFFELKGDSWEEITKQNMFSLKEFPCMIDGYIDLVI